MIVLAAAGLMVFSGTAFAKAAADIDQCRNGGLVTPPGTQTFVQCTGSGWVNGNAGQSNSHYREGESISYRAKITGLSAGQAVTLDMSYDIIHGGNVAIDYLTSPNRWQDPETTVGATPDLACSGVSPCTQTTPTLVTIPTPPGSINEDPSKSRTTGCINGATGASQPSTSFGALSTAEKQMQFFNVSGTPVFTYLNTGSPSFAYTAGGDQTHFIHLTFTASASTVVIAWGGHIASSFDWGCTDGARSAGGVSGSPYHMRLEDMFVGTDHISLGNQDRSLSAAAVLPITSTTSTTVLLEPGNTAVAVNGHIAVGSSVHDSATVSPNPGAGTVSFYFFGNGVTCPASGFTGGVAAGTIAVNASGTATPSTSEGPLSPGSYNFKAHYNGSGANQPGDSNCEPFIVDKASPTITTTASSTVKVGGNITDTATLSGGFSPTGAITFDLYGPNDATCATSIATLNATSPTTGNGPYTSQPFTTTAAGTYRWIAHFATDTNNNAANTACNDANESVAVIDPSILVTKLPHTQTVVSGGTATWTIRVTNNGDSTLTGVHVTDGQAPNCVKDPVPSATGGTLVPASPRTAGTLIAGQYFEYTCTKVNITAAFDNVVVACGTSSVGPADDVCDDDPATLDDRTGHVGLLSLASTQDFVPNDNGTVSGANNPNGSITFKLYKGTCDLVNQLYSQTVSVDAQGKASTTNASLLSTLVGSLDTSGTFNWQLSYGGDTNNNADIIGACGTEHFTVTNN